MMQGQITDPKAALAFMTAGKATVTFVSTETSARYTFKISKKTESIYYVKVLRGSNNETDYGYIGFIKDTTFVFGGDKASCKIDTPCVKAFNWSFRSITHATIPATLQAWHEGRVGRCAKKLTVPPSQAPALAPECANMIVSPQT